jgi:hypothetical protein
MMTVEGTSAGRGVVIAVVVVGAGLSGVVADVPVTSSIGTP